MGHRWKRWYASASAEPEIDLLSAVFGLPSRRDLKRASETTRRKHSPRYDSGSDATKNDDDGDDDQNEQSDDSSDQPSIHDTTRRSDDLKLRHSATSIRKSMSKKRQHTHSRSSSAKSQRSTLSKKTKCSSELKNKTRTCKRPSASSIRRDEESSSASVSPSARFSTANVLQKSQETVPSPGLFSSNIQRHVANDTSRSTFPYMLQPIPTFLPHYAPAYLVHSGKYPQETQTSEWNRASTSFSIGSNFQNLQRLQLLLDRLHRELLKQPTDSQLHNDYQSAQNQLNSLLDSMVARKSNGMKQTSLDKAKTPAETLKSREPLVDKENVAPASIYDEAAVESYIPSEHHDCRDRTFSIAHLREKSPSRTIRHHLCSGCGSVRSQKFHEKHPIGTWHKPVLNFCSFCREKLLKKGRIEKYHFCFGCGKVRSKAFQKKYKPKPGHALLPNYCGNCTAEVRVNEELNEMSVLESTTAHSISPPEQGCSIADTGSSNLPGLFRDGLPSHCDSDLPIEEFGAKTSRSRNEARLRLDHVSAENTSSVPVSPAESSPFYPGRRLGSAQRRAQREVAKNFKEYQKKPRDSLNQGGYHAPYVEEEDSVSEQRMSLSNYGSTVESSNNGGFSEERQKNKECQGSKRRSSGTEGQNWSPDFIYERAAPLQSTNSSSERTLRYHHLDNRGQHREKITEDPRHNRQDFPRPDSFCEPSRFPTGVFGKSNKEGEDGPGQGPRRKSPLGNGEWSHYSTISNKQEDRTGNRTKQPDPPAFRSSRGAFGPGYSPKQPHFTMDQHDQARCSRSGIRSPNAQEDMPAGHRNPSSPSLSGSNAGKPPNKFNSHTPNETAYARSVFTDYSRSTDNPYYKPRARPFRNAANSDFCDTWDWRSNRGRNTQNNQRPGDGPFDGHVPEPIIEEPVSPSSSPVQPTKLLGQYLYLLAPNSHPTSLLEFHIPNDESSGDPDSEDGDCSAESIALNSTVSSLQAAGPMSATAQ
ncbi:uncharacterized protein MAM_02025 [Metarhizium album ARSEF 1941]|uniref:Uncharacterized protein n=1 Tax=Metarhizium album (strain ARSEF 1941) TaxID=1081103 RepID=A0A0B2WVF9_METAS|nr:uncharacterized protein MAM_02025 [Metarhizium album ARSEF 1941]KHO00102.1 hypothetical protein MAM_02025 [Metarhizium album ARSEF 1941]